MPAALRYVHVEELRMKRAQLRLLRLDQQLSGILLLVQHRRESGRCGDVPFARPGEIVRGGNDVRRAEEIREREHQLAPFRVIDVSQPQLLAEFERAANGEQDEGGGIADHSLGMLNRVQVWREQDRSGPARQAE